RELRLKAKRVVFNPIPAQHRRQARLCACLSGIDRQQALPLCRLPTGLLQLLECCGAQAGDCYKELIATCRGRLPSERKLSSRLSINTKVQRDKGTKKQQEQPHQPL